MVKHKIVFAIGILVASLQTMAMPAFHLFTETDSGSELGLSQLRGYDSLTDVKALNSSSTVNTSGHPFGLVSSIGGLTFVERFFKLFFRTWRTGPLRSPSCRFRYHKALENGVTKIFTKFSRVVFVTTPPYDTVLNRDLLCNG